MSTRLTKSAPVALALACCGLTAGTRAFGAVPAIYSLGKGSFPGGINSTGQVAGSYQPIGTVDQAALFDGIPYTGAAVRNVPTAAGYKYSYGTGINKAGQMTGNDLTADFQRYRAYRYDGAPNAGGAKRDLGTLGGQTSFAWGVNDLGQVTGSAEHATGGPIAAEAYVYTGTPGTGGAMHPLGTLGGTRSEGNAINNAGQVAGFSLLDGDDVNHAFRYDGAPGAGVMHDLHTMAGYAFSSGYSVNALGQVVGLVATEDFSVAHAFVYRGTPGAGGAMVDLGTVNGGVNSSASCITDAGFILGYSEDADTVLRMVLWRPDGSAADLDAWFDAVNPDAGAQWTLNSGISMNAAGLITGFGEYTDPVSLSVVQAGFVLDAGSLIPEPGSVALWSPAAAMLLRRRRAAKS